MEGLMPVKKVTGKRAAYKVKKTHPFACPKCGSCANEIVGPNPDEPKKSFRRCLRCEHTGTFHRLSLQNYKQHQGYGVDLGNGGFRHLPMPHDK